VSRERREELRRERGADHCRMRRKLVSIGDDYWVENNRGGRVYQVDGTALWLRKTLILEDARGAELVKIQERILDVHDTMEIQDWDGTRVAMVKKALITPLYDRWTVKVPDGPDLEIKGNILDHEDINEDGRPLAAEVSKRWFRVADTYGVEIAPAVPFHNDRRDEHGADRVAR